MSASREKKQRQGGPVSDKGAQARQEQAAYKRKVRLYTAIGVVVVVLVAALLIWNSGFFQSRATAATVGDEKLSAAELSYYYYDARYIYAAYGIIDTSLGDDEQMYNEEEGTTYRDFFLEQALTNAKSDQAIYDAALAAGHSLSEVKDDLAEQVSAMKSSASSNGYSYKSYLKAIFGRFITTGVYEDMVARELLIQLYTNEVQAEKREGITAQELEAYYEENPDSVDTFEYSYLYFKADETISTDAEGNELSEEELAALKEENMAAAKAKAEQALALYEGGMGFDKVIVQTDDATGSGDHTTTVGLSSVSSVYRDKLAELDEGEAALVEYEDTGWYVVVFHSRYRDEDLLANVRHILVKAETTTDDEGNTVAPTDEAWAAAQEKAEQILAEFQAGEQTDEAFAALAEEHSDDGRNDDGALANAGGLYTDITKSSSYVSEFLDWCVGDDRPQVGEAGLVRHEGAEGSSSSYWGYHVMYLQSWGEAEWCNRVRATLTSQAMTEWSDALQENYAAALTDGADSIGR